MKKNRTRVALVVYDYDDNFDQLTDFLKIQPTAVHEAAPGRVRLWELRSGISEPEPLEDHLDDLLEKLRPSAAQLSELSKKYRCKISVGLEYYELNPEIELGHEALQSLAELGVSLWLDIYNLSEDTTGKEE
jgi:hypothetical protein